MRAERFRGAIAHEQRGVDAHALGVREEPQTPELDGGEPADTWKPEALAQRMRLLGHRGGALERPRLEERRGERGQQLGAGRVVFRDQAGGAIEEGDLAG